MKGDTMSKKTDMEAKAFVDRFFGVLEDRIKAKAQSDLDHLVTEAHREGMEAARARRFPIQGGPSIPWSMIG